MERLTIRDSRGRAYFDNDGVLICGANGVFHQKKDMTAQYIHDRFVALDQVIDRLAAYEDIGLTPEEINEFLHQSYGPLHKKLGEWIVADQDGRLVVQPPNAPLTLEELREMDGEPVFIKCLFNDELSSYVVVDKRRDSAGIFTRLFYASFDYYGHEWLAYRRRPEE